MKHYRLLWIVIVQIRMIMPVFMVNENQIKEVIKAAFPDIPGKGDFKLATRSLYGALMTESSNVDYATAEKSARVFRLLKDSIQDPMQINDYSNNGSLANISINT